MRATRSPWCKAPGLDPSRKAQITNGRNLRTDDANGDGVNNDLQEFLFGTSPIAGNGSLVTATARAAATCADLHWLQRGNAPVRPQSCKQSTTLGIAGSMDFAVVPMPQHRQRRELRRHTDDGAPTDVRLPRSAAPAEASGGKLFVRIQGAENVTASAKSHPHSRRPPRKGGRRIDLGVAS